MMVMVKSTILKEGFLLKEYCTGMALIIKKSIL